MNIIKKIEIRHFRSINEETLEELGHFNVFAGTNDSGKSNLLRALNLFFNGETSFLTDYNFSEDYSKRALYEARQKKKGRQFISIKIYFNEEAIKGKDQLKKLAKKNDGLWIKREWWKYVDNYKEQLPDFIESASQGIKRSFSVFLSEIRFIYIPAFKSNDVFSHVLSMVGNEEGAFIDQKAKDDLNKQIADSASDLAKDFSSLTGISTKVSLPITLDSFWASLQVATDFDKEGIKSGFKRGTSDDYLIDLIARGEGIKSIFTPIILGWLANNNKERYWIWGIDEPENSLESKRTIALYKKFIDYSKAAQIFVSSHSPVFIFPNEEASSKIAYTFITTQDRDGDTKFKRISTFSIKMKDELCRDFGVDYGTFLAMQNEYAGKLRKAELLRSEITLKISEISRPIVFVEGELDEKYFRKAIAICRKGKYPAEIKWIGSKDESGQARFTGKPALNKLKLLLETNPGLIKGKKIVLLYDVDVKKSRYANNGLLVLSPKVISDKHYITGTEHLLKFPEDFDYKPFTICKVEKRGDTTITINEPNKKDLCEYVMSLNDEQLALCLESVNDVLTEIEPFFK